MGSTDDTDEKILRMLKENAREPFVSIAKGLNLKEPSIRRRVRLMTERGTIRRFTIERGDADVTRAIVLVSVESATETSTVSTLLRSISGVETVYEITGQYDIAAVIGAPNIAAINSTIDAVRKIPGVMDTNSVIILRTLS